MANIYTKYKVSKSLNGDKIIYLARVGKQQKLAMRADSEEKLVKLMAAEAKRIDEEVVVKQKEQKEKLAAASPKKKKLGLWKPGKLLQNDTTTPEVSEVDGSELEASEPSNTVEDLS